MRVNNNINQQKTTANDDTPCSAAGSRGSTSYRFGSKTIRNRLELVPVNKRIQQQPTAYSTEGNDSQYSSSCQPTNARF